MKRFIPYLIMLGFIGLIIGCTSSSQSGGEPVVDNDVFELINDESYLYENEIVTDGTELFFEEESDAQGGEFTVLAQAKFFRMFKVAKVKAPEHEGETLQATDVAIAGNKETSYAYVSYVMAGLPRHGGIDVLELKKGYFPKIKSRLFTKKDDVNSVAYETGGNRLYMGLNVDPDEYGVSTGAYFRTADLDADFKVKVSGENIVSAELDLNSFAANDAAVFQNFALVPVGAFGGGVEVIKVTSAGGDNPPLLERKIFISDIEDTRAVAVTPDIDGVDFIVYRGPDIDNDPKIVKYSYDESAFTKEGEIPITPKPVYTETKSALEVHGNVAFLAASDGGAIAVNLENNKIIFTICNPTGDLDADLVTANAVTAGTPQGSTQSLLFIANGEYGVRAYELGFDIENSDNVAQDLADFDPQTAYKGYINLGSGNSSNSLLFRNGYLFVGTGLGGVNVISIMDKSINPVKWAKPSL